MKLNTDQKLIDAFHAFCKQNEIKNGIIILKKDDGDFICSAIGHDDTSISAILSGLQIMFRMGNHRTFIVDQ